MLRKGGAVPYVKPGSIHSTYHRWEREGDGKGVAFIPPTTDAAPHTWVFTVDFCNIYAYGNVLFFSLAFNSFNLIPQRLISRYYFTVMIRNTSVSTGIVGILCTFCVSLRKRPS